MDSPPTHTHMRARAEGVHPYSYPGLKNTPFWRILGQKTSPLNRKRWFWGPIKHLFFFQAKRDFLSLNKIKYIFFWKREYSQTFPTKITKSRLNHRTTMARDQCITDCLNGIDKNTYVFLSKWHIFWHRFNRFNLSSVEIFFMHFDIFTGLKWAAEAPHHAMAMNTRRSVQRIQRYSTN